MKKKLLFLAMAMVLLLSSGCAAGQQSSASGSPAVSTEATGTAVTSAESGDAKLPDAEFTLFIPDQTAKIPPDDAPVMKQIYELTGVRIKRIIPPAEPLERLNVMLATDDLPDLITFWDSTIMRQYIDAGKILRLNELMEENCPDVLHVNWKDFGNRLYDKDGNLYYMPGGYSIGGLDDNLPETTTGLNVRTALFEDIGYDKMPETFDDYLALLSTVKEKYPGMSPVSLALGAQGQLSDLISIAAGAYGLEEADGLVRSNGTLIHFSQSPEMKAFFAFLNGLNTAGYLDIESPVLSFETLKQKAVAGKVWSYWGSGWEINSEVIAYEAGNGSNEQMIYSFPKANDGVAKVTYARGARNLYNTGVTITTKCADPARFLKFYDYCNTEEGHLNVMGIVNWDFKGENTIEATEDYNYVVMNDKEELIPGRKIVQETAWMGQQWAADENWWWNWGVEMMDDFTYYTGNHPKGKYDVMGDGDVGMWWDENTTRINEAHGWTGLNYFPKMREMYIDTSEYAGLQLDPTSDEYAAKLAIQQAYEKGLPKAVMAKSPAEFETEWAAMMADMEKEGLSTYLAKCNEFYKARMEQWAANK